MKIFYLILALLIVTPAQAQLKEYDHFFEVDLDEDIPPLYELEKEYTKETSQYRWNYSFRWNMSSFFNSEFKKHITDFGSIEKRIANIDEDNLLNDLKRIPKPFYQYLGPLLHTVRGLSGKILDLPGIKETKNKFPTDIASRFRNMPNIEYASPAMYVFLNPMLWGENMASIEFPQEYKQPEKKKKRPRINPKALQYARSKVNILNYSGLQKSNPSKLSFRHFFPDKDTPLSKSDVRAFIQTLDGLDKFRKHNHNELTLIMIDRLIEYWDIKNGIPQDFLLFRQSINPCQHFVRKIRWSGLQSEFQDAIGGHGFGIKDWAYTCDKIVKAHRVHNAPYAMVWASRYQRDKSFYPVMEKFMITSQEKKQIHFFLDTVGRLYLTTQENIDAIRPYNFNLRMKFLDIGRQMGGTPLLYP